MLASLNRLTLSFFFSLIILAGCGSGVLMASGTSGQVTVFVTGANVVAIGAPVPYSATVQGATSSLVNWSVQGASPSEDYGFISAAGLYTPPASVPVHGQIYIVATSQSDPTKSSSTAVTLSNPVPVINSATLSAGYHSSFLVDVHGSNFMPASVLTYSGYGVATTFVSSSEMRFTLTSPPPAGTLISLGVITPAPGRTQSAAYAATVPANIAVTLTGNTIAAAGVAPMQFSATVTGTTNTGLTWTIAGASSAENYGTISQTGLYTPPSSVPVHGQISIVATSKADTTKSAWAGVLIEQPVASIASATLTAAANGTYLVDVKGSNFIPASAAVPGSYGVPTTYVSSNELMFTLTGRPDAGTIVPLSVINPAPGRTVSASYSMVVPGAIAVAVSGSPIASVGNTVQYTATVTGTRNTAVTWAVKGLSASEDYGSISNTGIYTPPAKVPVHGGIQIVATSLDASAKSNALNVTIQQPTPVITSATLMLAAKGTYLVDVFGRNFVPNSNCIPGASGVPTTYLGATHLQFTLVNPTAYGSSEPLTVVNPAPGLQQSAVYNLVISTAVAVSLTGPSQVLIGTPAQYTAAASGAPSSAVTWSINGPSAAENYGTVSAAGLYTPPPAVPAHNQFYLTATSVADPTKKASEFISIANPMPAITSAVLTPGYHSTFLVDVYGTGFLPASQLLYLGYGSGSAYLSGTHLQFTIHNAPAPGTIEPISVVTPAPGRVQSASYNLTIPGLVGVTVAGAAQTIAGTPSQYTATVNGASNQAVTWTLSGVSAAENYGTIAANGLYTPPASVPAHNYITIAATSKADSTKWASMPVTIMNAVPVINTASTATVAGGAVSIDVIGANFLPSSIVWYSGYGLLTTYVSPTELKANMPYTTAVGITNGAPITIWVVTPNPGRTQSANFNVDMPGKVWVTIAGRNIVATSETAQYVSGVYGSHNNAVTWSVKSSDGSDPGTITSTGLYTPPASITGNKVVTIIATSQVQTTSNATEAVNLVSVPSASAVRLLEQSTFGPSESLVAHVQSIGLSNYVDEQLALPPTLMQLQSAFTFSCGTNPAVCMDENWWNDAVTAPDQLRQRVSLALAEMLVVSYEEANPAMVGTYSNLLTQDAFANWSTIMKDMTLSAGMGRYLNMANSGKPAAGAIANENFARENMQLFNIGLDLLNQDGTVQTDSTGNPIPAYTEAQVEAFSRVFTGWTYAPATGTPAIFPNYSTWNPYVPMIAFDSQHDTTSKALLYTTLPAGQSATQDLDAAIQDIFHHPNVGPFVTTQLIQKLVKSNPSPAYVGRVSAVFANDGTGVRGNMAAVVKAILLDPEARAGDTAADPNDGYLREPILWTANVLRALNAVPKPGVTDNSAYTAIDSFTGSLQESIFYSPTVFNFYPTSYTLAGTSLNAPQFALETSARIMTKLTLASAAVNNLLGKLMVDLSATGPLGTLAAASNDLLLDELNRLYLHGTMSAQMRSAIETALSGINDPAQRVRTAVYLVITSSQYKVIH